MTITTATATTTITTTTITITTATITITITSKFIILCLNLSNVYICGMSSAHNVLSIRTLSLKIKKSPQFPEFTQA